MRSRWDDSEAEACQGDPLKVRVYTSRLIGADPNLVLHGGGNTSVKVQTKTLLGESLEIIYVKGSGWDLATIEPAGFAPVRLDVLRRLGDLESLSDAEMVRQQRAAMLDPYAPNPSVEAILHAIIPARFVDHTHADAVVTLTNTERGTAHIREVFGDRVLIIPYVMPGFVLSRAVREATQDIDWNQYEGIILLNHGIFTFGDDARTSYERMIQLVSEAEDYLHRRGATQVAVAEPETEDLLAFAQLRRAVSDSRGQPVLARLDRSPKAVGFANLNAVAKTATRGPLTPDHVIRTKRLPLLLDRRGRDPQAALSAYEKNYQAYFEAHSDDELLACLDPAPRWAVWPRQGTIAFGRNTKETRIVADIVRHTRRSIQAAEALGGWRPLGAKAIFEVEYWELEQAKLRQAKPSATMSGKIALVTGAASGIGLACAKVLQQLGAAVVGVDIAPKVIDALEGEASFGLRGDVTEDAVVAEAITTTVRSFGGLDIVVSNAGSFPSSQRLEELDPGAWQQSLALNLTSHQQLMRHATPYLRHGIDPVVVFIASRNVHAPGPGAAAYSVAKAGLTQLARIAALELAADGVRVNVVHPDCVYDTAIWSDKVLKQRAKEYGLSVQQYKRRNLLKTDVSSEDVAAMVAAVVGPAFAKTTGAQIPVDGGNDRVV